MDGAGPFHELLLSLSFDQGRRDGQQERQHGVPRRRRSKHGGGQRSDGHRQSEAEHEILAYAQSVCARSLLFGRPAY